MPGESQTEFVALLPGAYSVPGEAGETPHLIGSRCRACHATVFPKMAVCPACHAADTMEDTAMGRQGRLFNFTIAHVAPQGFEAPYFQAFVDIPEGPRIFSLISADVPVQAGALEDGMALELVIEPIGKTADNVPILTYKYRPAKNQPTDMAGG